MQVAGIEQAGQCIGETQGAIALFTLTQRLFGASSLGDVLQGFDGPDNIAIGIAQGRGRKKQPAATVAEMRKKILSLIASRFHLRRPETTVVEAVDSRLAGAIEHAPDRGRTWRAELTPFLHSLGHEVYDPVLDEMKSLTDEERLNFRVWKTTDLGRYRVALHLNNLLDKSYRAGVDELPGLGRNAVLTFSAKFQ